MASPLGNRKNAKFMAVSTAPSINKTPMGASTPPVPYPVCHDLSNSVGVVPHVKLNGDPAYVLAQTTQPHCTGDEPGTAKGIKSGTVTGEIKPTSASKHVKITGKYVVRVGDTCTLNSGNCPGVYVAGPTAAPPGTDPNPPIVPETPQEKAFLQKLGLWWEETKTEVGEAVARPLEATKGAVKDTLNIVPQLGTLLMQGGAMQGAGDMQQAAAIQSALGNKEMASQLSSTAEGVKESAHELELSQFVLSNPAQAGGAKIATAVQLATGIAGLAKGAAKVGARQLVKMGAKEAGALEKAAVKEGMALSKEAATVEKGAEEAATAGKVGNTGDGFHVKGQADPGGFGKKDTYVLGHDGVPIGAQKGIVKPGLSAKTLSKKGWPDLPGSGARNFNSAEPVTLEPGTKIYRVIDDSSNQAGGYWVEKPPASRAEWRRDIAVKTDWNTNGKYVEYTVPEGPGLNVWRGEVSAQQLQGSDFYLPGGGQQIWMPPGSVNPSLAKPTGW